MRSIALHHDVWCDWLFTFPQTINFSRSDRHVFDLSNNKAGYHMIIKIAIVSCLACISLLAQEKQEFESILSEMRSSSPDKNASERKTNNLISLVRALNEDDKRKLYSLIMKGIAMHDDNPFANSNEWNLIGIILKETKDRDLIIDILVNSPPPEVGFSDLNAYLKNTPPDILSEVILKGHHERVALQQRISAHNNQK